jgi:hypothetical protein
MRPLLSGLFAIALCAASLQAQDAAGPAAPDVVSLSFDWPAGMAAHVTGYRYRAQESSDGLDTTRTDFTYELRVREDPQGLRIDFEDFRVPGATEESAVEDRVALALAGLTPSYVVSPDGDLLDVLGLEEMIETTESYLRPMLDSAGSPALEQYMAQLLTPEVVQGQVAEEWVSLVAAWVEAEFELGQAYELETEEPLPVLGGQLVPFRYEFGALDRVACTDGDEERRCVELIMRSSPDPEAIGDFVEAFTSRLMREAAGESAPALTLKDLSIENEVVLIAEPGSLIPHELTITRHTSTTVEAGGMEEAASDVRVRYYAYDYGR